MCTDKNEKEEVRIEALPEVPSSFQAEFCMLSP